MKAENIEKMQYILKTKILLTYNSLSKRRLSFFTKRLWRALSFNTSFVKVLIIYFSVRVLLNNSVHKLNHCLVADAYEDMTFSRTKLSQLQKGCSLFFQLIAFHTFYKDFGLWNLTIISYIFTYCKSSVNQPSLGHKLG